MSAISALKSRSRRKAWAAQDTKDKDCIAKDHRHDLLKADGQERCDVCHIKL